MARLAIAALLLTAGILSAAPGLILLGVLTAITTALSSLWTRRGLDDVRYERRLANDRAVWGDRVDLEVVLESRKLLPLAWIRADDFATDNLEVVAHRLSPSDRPGIVILRNLWSLAPFERVTRHFQVDAGHRGRVRFDTVRLTVADLFGRDVASRENDQPATLLIRPRTVPVHAARGAVVPLGSRRARRGLAEDPSLFAGVRPFQPGDPRRRVHQRASARVGKPLSKRFDPSTARQVVIALDIQTQDGAYWLMQYDEDLMESLAVAAASLARRLLADGAACALAFNGWTYSPAHIGFVPPRAGDDQLTRIADLLARSSSYASVPFDRVLGSLPTRLAPGTLVIAVSSRDPIGYAPSLRRLRASGFEIRLVTMGPRSHAYAAQARRAGLDAVAGGLDPDWRTSHALTLAG